MSSLRGMGVSTHAYRMKAWYWIVVLAFLAGTVISAEKDTCDVSETDVTIMNIFGPTGVLAIIHIVVPNMLTIMCLIISVVLVALCFVAAIVFALICFVLVLLSLLCLILIPLGVIGFFIVLAGMALCCLIAACAGLVVGLIQRFGSCYSEHSEKKQAERKKEEDIEMARKNAEENPPVWQEPRSPPKPGTLGHSDKTGGNTTTTVGTTEYAIEDPPVKGECLSDYVVGEEMSDDEGDDSDY